MKSDRGIISGFIGVAIHMTIQHILQHIYIANRCKKELAVLKELIMSIELTILHIQQNRLVFKTEKDKENAPSAVNRWLNDLDDLLLRASEIVQQCSIPESRVNFSGCQPKKKISSLNKDIREHLTLSPLLVRVPEDQVGGSQKVLVGLGQTKDRLEALASSATTSETARKNLMVSDSVLTALSQMGDADKENKEPYIVRQSQAFENLQELVLDDAKAKNISVFGKRGSGKSLLLRTVYNKQEVRTHFSEGLILWLTVSQKFSFTSLVNDLCKQIAIQKNDLDLIKDKEEEEEQKNWLNQQLQKSRRFVLFLDDVCENNATRLLEGLGIMQSVSNHSNSKVVASYRDPNASSKMGIADEYSITIPALKKYESWELFKQHAFPYNKGNAPFNIDEDAKRVCEKCGGLPLAIKVVGRAMAGGTDLRQWKWALHSLRKATQDTTESSGPKATEDTIESSGPGDTQETTESSGPKATQETTETSGPRATQDTTESSGSRSTQETTEISGPRATQDTAEGSRPKATQDTTESSGPKATQDTTEISGPRSTEEITEISGPRATQGTAEGSGPRSTQEITEISGPRATQDTDEGSGLKLTQDTTEISAPKATQDTTESSGARASQEITESSGPKATQETTENSGPRATQGTAESSGSRSTQETTEISGPTTTQDTTEGIGPNATKGTTESIGQPLNACLRLSLDALGNQDFNLQLCFLYIAAAFSEDAIIDAQEVIPLLIGEGLLARKELKHVPQHTVLADRRLIEPMIINTEGRPVCLRMQDPFELGRLYLDLLAERCLIEPTARDASGRVLCFRMIKVVHDWAIPIAKDEENFYYCVDNSLEDLQKDGSAKNKRIFLSCDKLEDLQKDGSAKNKRIFLSCNKLSSFPQFSSPPDLICSLISQNKELKIPKKVFGSMLSLNSMLSLKVLDLSGTSAASLPENVGRLKQLRCLKLSGRPIKRLPKSLTALGYLEILDVSFTDIEELPSNIHLLRSLRYLGLRGCRKLHNLPCNISGLLSLQYLYLDGCYQLKETPSSRCKKVASLQSLFDLIQLKKFALQINSEQSIREGTLGSMTELDTLLLVLPEMESLPYDINNLSKLRSLSLKCSKLRSLSLKCSKLVDLALGSMTELVTLLLVLPEMVSLPYDIKNLSKLGSLSLKCSKLVDLEAFTCSDLLRESENKKENVVTNLKHLRYLKFFECGRLKDIQHLHKLKNLRQLEIILCPEVRNFPQEFGGRDAFPALKIFSLVGLQNLQELPGIEEGAMPSLEVFNIMNCPELKILPECYLKTTRFRLRVYGCPKVNVAANGNSVQVQVSRSEGTKDIITSTKEIINKYRQALQKKEDEDWLYGEFWCDEFFLLVEGLTAFV